MSEIEDPDSGSGTLLDETNQLSQDNGKTRNDILKKHRNNINTNITRGMQRRVPAGSSSGSGKSGNGRKPKGKPKLNAGLANGKLLYFPDRHSAHTSSGEGDTESGE